MNKELNLKIKYYNLLRAYLILFDDNNNFHKKVRRFKNNLGDKIIKEYKQIKFQSEIK